MNIEELADMNVNVEVELGKTKLSLGDILNLKKGSIIELEKAAGESSEILVNKRIVAKGEILVFDKFLSLRINEIPEYDTIFKYLKEEKNLK
jgi:flagellar motor switch protein FliN